MICMAHDESLQSHVGSNFIMQNEPDMNQACEVAFGSPQVNGGFYRIGL